MTLLPTHMYPRYGKLMRVVIWEARQCHGLAPMIRGMNCSPWRNSIAVQTAL